MLDKLLKVGCGIFALSIVPAILFPVVNYDGGSHRMTCGSNLKQIGLGIMQYTQDYDEVLPSITLSSVHSSVPPYETPYGWADALQPYLRSTRLYQCYGEPTPANPTSDAVANNFTDYWFNANLADMKLGKIKHPASILMNGDGNDGVDSTNARYNRKGLPLTWLTDQTESKPATRHHGSAYYVFLDGHAKIYTPEQLASVSSRKGVSPFAIQ